MSSEVCKEGKNFKFVTTVTVEQCVMPVTVITKFSIEKTEEKNSENPSGSIQDCLQKPSEIVCEEEPSQKISCTGCYENRSEIEIKQEPPREILCVGTGLYRDLQGNEISGEMLCADPDHNTNRQGIEIVEKAPRTMPQTGPPLYIDSDGVEVVGEATPRDTDVVSDCNGACLGDKVFNFSHLDNIKSSIDEFSIELFKNVSEIHKNENLVMSPLSANIALFLASLGAGGQTAQEIRKSLKMLTTDISNSDDVKLAYQEIIDKLNNSRSDTLKLINKVFINNCLEVKEEFKTSIKENLRSSEEQLDFKNSEIAANHMNSWISQETNGKIEELLDSKNIDEETSIIIANVLYFKGKWQNKFSEDITEMGNFYSHDKVYTVPIMLQGVRLTYGKLPELDVEFIELPYEDLHMKMIIFVPIKRDGLEMMEQKLETMSLSSIRRNGHYRHIRLSMPKFKVESSIKMKEVLQKMGFKNMFEDTADFSGISDMPTKVDDVVHKAFIEVDEGGTEAAAATGISQPVPLSLPEYMDFRVDHPFHFKIIVDTGAHDSLTLFAGNCKSF